MVKHGRAADPTASLQRLATHVMLLYVKGEKHPEASVGSWAVACPLVQAPSDPVEFVNKPDLEPKPQSGGIQRMRLFRGEAQVP